MHRRGAAKYMEQSAGRRCRSLGAPSSRSEQAIRAPPAEGVCHGRFLRWLLWKAIGAVRHRARYRWAEEAGKCGCGRRDRIECLPRPWLRAVSEPRASDMDRHSGRWFRDFDAALTILKANTGPAERAGEARGSCTWKTSASSPHRCGPVHCLRSSQSQAVAHTVAALKVLRFAVLRSRRIQLWFLDLARACRRRIPVPRLARHLADPFERRDALARDGLEPPSSTPGIAGRNTRISR